jgi:hypothetical protein
MSDHNAIAIWRDIPYAAASVWPAFCCGFGNAASRWHVENPHFYGVLAIHRQKIAFFRRF